MAEVEPEYRPILIQAKKSSAEKGLVAGGAAGTPPSSPAKKADGHPKADAAADKKPFAAPAAEECKEDDDFSLSEESIIKGQFRYEEFKAMMHAWKEWHGWKEQGLSGERRNRIECCHDCPPGLRYG